jgi:uncharacterized protein YjcR
MKVGRRRKRPRIPKEQAKAMDLYMKGIFSTLSIAKEVNASQRTIQRWIKRYKWNMFYKQKYEKEAASFKDEIDRLTYLCTHRASKDN